MNKYIHLLQYYQPRNYFLRILQFFFWYLSDFEYKKPILEKLSFTIADSRAIMNLFTILEKSYEIFSKSVFFKEKNKAQQLIYLTCITSLCHISIHSCNFILNICGYHFILLEKIYNTFYACTMIINLMKYKIELDYIKDSKLKDSKEKKDEKNNIYISIIIIGFNLPLALNGIGLIELLLGIKLNKKTEGFLGFSASILQFYIASSKCLKEIKSNYSKKNM
jgi:hypothetical protein